jgi:iron complex outermembrane receptor protein
MKQVLALVGLFWLCCLQLKAQISSADTIKHLPDFTARGHRFESFNTGAKMVQTDSLVKLISVNDNIAQLLSYNSQVFIRAYGHNQIATSSFRGAGAQHTAVLWNGINLQNSLLGQTDLSLLPAGFMDDIGVYYGGNSALYGAGAIGGAIMLNNSSAFNKNGANYQIGRGSFGMIQHRLALTYGTNKSYIKARFYHQSAQNNIEYHNYTLAEKPLQKLVHAEQRSNGLMLETGYKINTKQEINLRYWYGYTDRDIPPTIGMAVNNSYQIDEANRLGIEWKRTSTKSRWIGRAAFVNEYLNYNDPTTYNSGISKSKTFISELENTTQINPNTALNFGVNYTGNFVQSSGYTKNVSRNSIAAFVSLNNNWSKKFKTTVNLRQDFIDTEFKPFTAGAGADYKFSKYISLLAQFNKSFRMPTLNDLYWVTGNLNLLPEQGYSQDLGLSAKGTTEHAYFSIQLNGFNRQINNWILWQPYGGSWTPQNLLQVWSRGIEWNTRYTYCYKKFMWSARGDLNYILSTNQKANLQNDVTVGKQLIYIPRLTYQTWLTFTYSNAYLAFNQTYTGYRFTSSDNSSFVDDYLLVNMFMGKTFKLKKGQVDIKFHINNIFNQEYQVLPSRPMPMRNFLFSLGVSF